MKKALFALLSGVILLSGCSFGQNEEEKQISSAQDKAQENPEALFFDLAQKNMNFSVEKMKEYFPSKEAFAKGKKSFSLNGEVSLAGTPLQKGDISFSLDGKSTGDYTNPEDVKTVQTLSFDGKITGAIVSGDAKGKIEMRVADNSIFASLQELAIHSPMIPQDQITALSKPLMGKWFGNTFEELKAIQGAQSQTMDIKKFMAGNPLGVIMWKSIEDEQAHLKDYITFDSFVEEKNGIFYFKAKYNIKKTTVMVGEFIDAIGAPEEAKVKMQKSLAAMKNETVTIGYKPSDDSFITFTSAAKDISTQEKIKGKNNVITLSKDYLSMKINMTDTDMTTIEAKDGKFSIGGSSDQHQNFTLVNGTYSATSMSFVTSAKELINDKDKKDGNTIPEFSGKFTKTGNTWAGQITNTVNKDIVVKIDNASYSKEKVTLSVTAEKTGAKGTDPITWGPINFVASIGAVNSVEVSTPENVLPFSDIETLLTPKAPTPEISEKGTHEIQKEPSVPVTQ